MLTLEFKPQDLRIGLYIKVSPYTYRLNIWLCLLPTLSLHLSARHKTVAWYVPRSLWAELAAFFAGGYWWPEWCEYQVHSEYFKHLHWVLSAYDLENEVPVDDIPF